MWVDLRAVGIRRALRVSALAVAGIAAPLSSPFFSTDATAQVPGMVNEESVRAIMQDTKRVAEGLAAPRGLLFMPNGDLVLTEQGAGTITRISPDGGIKRIAGFKQPRDIAVDARGNLYVADSGHDRIAVVTPDGKVSTWVGGLKLPVDLVFNAAGELLVCEYNAHRVLAFASPQKQRVVASGFKPHGLAIGADGTLYVADTTNKRIVKIGADGKAVTFVSDITRPVGMVFGKSGDLYVALRDEGKVVRVTRAGKRLTILDRLKVPRDPAFDREGSLYVAETAGGRVIKLAGGF